MEHLTLAAEQVRIGDRIYNRQATHPAFRWARVIEVRETTMANGRLGFELITSGWYTVADAKEAVAVQRLVNKPR